MLAIPENVSFEEAAMVEPLACVSRGLHETKSKSAIPLRLLAADRLG